MEKENNNQEQEKLEQLKNEISELEKAIEKKKQIEELERKKSELEAALNQEKKKNETKVLINETTVENDTENTDKFEKAKYILPVICEKDGYVEKLNAGEVGKISVDLGAGRLRKEDDIDKAVGIVLNKKNADKVKKGDILAFVYANNKQKGETAVEEMQDAYTIVEEPVKKEKYILGII